MADIDLLDASRKRRSKIPISSGRLRRWLTLNISKRTKECLSVDGERASCHESGWKAVVRASILISVLDQAGERIGSLSQ